MDDAGREHVEELTLEPVTVVRSRRPRALWAVLAAVAVAAGALVVTSAGEDGTQRPGLPVALGAAASPQSGAPAADSRLAWVTYVAGDGLPVLGGEAAAYRVAGTVDEGDVRALADALGLAGEVVQDGPAWRVAGTDGTLEVYEGGGAQWWYSSSAGISTCTASSEDPENGCSTTTTVLCGAADGPAECITGECPPGNDCALPADAPATPTTLACPPGTRCEYPPISPDIPCADDADGFDPCAEPPAPAADLPSEDEARAIALDLVRAIGVDVGDAVVTVDGPFDAWYVTVEPRLDGIPSGLLANVTVGADGKVTSAGGSLGTPERLGSYPVLDTRAAIDRANALQGDVTALGGGDDAVARDGAVATAVAPTGDEPVTTVPAPACKVQADGSEICEVEPGITCPQAAPPVDEPLGAPETVDCTPPPPIEPGVDPVPLPEPQPIEIVLVDAEPALVLLGAVDGSTDAYLVPGYRFTDADGGQVDLPAVADEALTTPPTTATTVPDDPGTSIVPDPGGVEPVDPEPCGDVLTEEDSSGSTHTIQPNPDCVHEPERIELMLHCVNIVDWKGLWWNTEAIDAPAGWVGRGTIVQEPDGTATYVDDGAPDEPTTFIAQGATETYPGCD